MVLLAVAMVAVVMLAAPMAEAKHKGKRHRHGRSHAGGVGAPARSDRLPDLGMAPLENLSLDNSNGRTLLRFDATIVNVGAGPFELHGSNRNANNNPVTMDTVTQRIYDTAGTYRDISTSATMFFAGDGHTHWHVKDLEGYEVDGLDNNSKVTTQAKSGFCFTDNVKYKLSLPGASQSPTYAVGCAANQPDATDVPMGLSVGWGDLYPSSLPDQYVDISGLPEGAYRLKATADHSNWFTESNTSNNETWVDLQITDSAVYVTGYGPSA